MEPKHDFLVSFAASSPPPLLPQWMLPPKTPITQVNMETPEPDRREDQSFPSSSSSSPSSSRVEEEESDRRSNGDNFDEQQRTRRSRTYHVNLLLSDVEASEVKDDIWSALAVLVTFWFFASMTMILGFYGSDNLQLAQTARA
ncbi:hypothetical protein ACFXTO_029603 [Malus domestica]